MTERHLVEQLRAFAAERDWEQFHTPKNLAMALAGEAGELLAIFQWLTPEQSTAVMDDPDLGQQIRDEVADVYAYLLRLADVLGIDPQAALAAKIESNEERYPASEVFGSAKKSQR